MNKITFLLFQLFLTTQKALAAETTKQPISTDLLNKAGTGAQYETSQSAITTVPQVVGSLIAVILSFVGTIFFILIIFSGLQWMTAGGNEEKVEQARTRMINASIGLAITVAAYFITWFISRALQAA